jgi:UDP-N-acetylmuramate--alanine ligase
MSGLALVAQALGASVSGSDRAESTYLERLRAAGIDALVGHDADAVPPDAEVVVSTAIGDDNPELAAARERGQAVIHRGELLGEVSRLKRSIVVAGTHGKTTTASMIAHALTSAGADASYLIGGELRSTGANAAWGEGEWAVIEADESDRSFFELAPEVAVITNIELDHHANWASLSELRSGFARFAAPAHARILWSDLAQEVPALTAPGAVTYGIGTGEVSAEGLELRELGSSFEVLGAPCELAVPGRHNALNALAAIAACREAGVDPAAAAAALGSFTGAARRFEPHGTTASGARVYDDYAHHPSEVAATLEAARELGASRLFAWFQPHLYSRTRHLAREFGRALALADVVGVLDIYPAREDPADFPGVSGWLVAARAADAAAGRPVYWLPTIEDSAAWLAGELGDGDVLLTMGAGDVDRLATALTAGS